LTLTPPSRPERIEGLNALVLLLQAEDREKSEKKRLSTISVSIINWSTKGKKIG